MQETPRQTNQAETGQKKKSDVLFWIVTAIVLLAILFAAFMATLPSLV